MLDEPARTSGRFRIYSPLVVDRIRFIKKAQVLGFTLGEIRELVQFNGDGPDAPRSGRGPLFRSQAAYEEGLDFVYSNVRTETKYHN